MNLKFITEFLKRPIEIGAIAPSSSYLAEQMTPSNLFVNTKVIIELGAGTGIFTEKILRKMEPGCKLILLETNERFFENLVNRFGSREDILILNKSAEELTSIVRKNYGGKIDLIISGLPFSSLGIEKTTKILDSVKEVLVEGGNFITFQYSMYLKGIFEEKFNDVSYKKELRNLPPAYILKCTDRKKESPHEEYDNGLDCRR